MKQLAVNHTMDISKIQAKIYLKSKFNLPINSQPLPKITT